MQGYVAALLSWLHLHFECACVMRDISLLNVLILTCCLGIKVMKRVKLVPCFRSFHKFFAGLYFKSYILYQIGFQIDKQPWPPFWSRQVDKVSTQAFSFGPGKLKSWAIFVQAQTSLFECQSSLVQVSDFLLAVFYSSCLKIIQGAGNLTSA